MGVTHKAISVNQYVDYVGDPGYRVQAVLEFDEGSAKKGDYGACITIYKLGESDGIATHPHVHYDLSGQPPHTISAHFKQGKSKMAMQGWDLKPWDAFALLFQLRASNLVSGAFKPISCTRVTLGVVKNLIRNNNLPHLSMLMKSEIYALKLWERDAFTLLERWIAGEDVSGELN